MVNSKPTNIVILVAEDDPLNCLLLEVQLKKHFELECEVIHALDGQEAVDICFSRPDIDLVLMDIKLPVLSGNDAAAKIKSRFPGLPVIVQTAYSSRADRERAFEYGCDDFITKPVKKEKLFTVLRKYLKIDSSD